MLAKDLKFFKNAENNFANIHNSLPTDFFAAPGRVEVIGNHTDHQKGKTLSMCVDSYIYAAVRKTNTSIITAHNKGYKTPIIIDVDQPSFRHQEIGTSHALIRGVLAYFKKQGYKVGGFNSSTISSIPTGMGMSSSAAFEVLFAKILNYYYNDNSISDLEIANAARFAEQEYFGKPCGLLDQLTIATGGVILCDFSKDNPVVQKLEKIPGHLEFLIINTGKSHKDLTSEYKQITVDNNAISNYFNKSYLNDVQENDFYDALNNNKISLPLKVVNRAKHFFKENKRVTRAFKDLVENNEKSFIKTISESGFSSRDLLSNLTYEGDITKELLTGFNALSPIKNCGVRVHGGGFAGTILVVYSRNEHTNNQIHNISKTLNFKVIKVKLATYKSGFIKEV